MQNDNVDVDESSFDDRRSQAEQRGAALREDAAPEPVGVYDRPEQPTITPAMIALVSIVLLLVAVVILYVFVF